MPETHQAHREQESQIGCNIFIFKPPAFESREHKTVVNMIPEKTAQADMPAVPEIADVAGQEWPVEILGGMDAEHQAEANCKSTVASKVEEQVKGVGVHVGDDLQELGPMCNLVQPVRLNQRRQDELV